MDYEASDGREIFLSFDDERGTLFGLLRLRIQNKPIAGLKQEASSTTALIRELHIYGPEVSLKEHPSNTGRAAAQHKGLGKALLAEAERIAREEFHSPEMAVLSGVGARDYYRAEGGYGLRGEYMVKRLCV
jgi:elongator complex protein 3